MSDASYWMRPLGLAQEWVGRIVTQGDTVIDATMGNGYDTLFLAQHVGRVGSVYAFDIQSTAVENTRTRLMEAGEYGDHVHLLVRSHAHMAECVDTQVKAVMFNLGYLPGGDKSVISETAETLKALNIARDLLIDGGMMTVMCYPGHLGGDAETEAVCQWAQSLNSDIWRVIKVEHLNSTTRAPLLVVVMKRG